jgi:hypothetical protein
VAAGVAQDVIRRQLVKLFHHTNTGGFLLLLLELLLLPWKLRKARHSTSKKPGKDEKLVFIGQRILKTVKHKL